MIRAVCLLLLANTAQADSIDVQFQDGNPVDRFVIFNKGCPLADITVTLDFTTSAGQIVIDTAYGTIGTRDPSDVQIIEGDATLRPVNDGDRSLTLDVATLPNLGAVTVTMDVDDSVSLFEDDRVQADGPELAGTTIKLQINETATTATLDDTGRTSAIIPAKASACALS